MSEDKEVPMDYTNAEDLYTADDKRPEPSAPPKTSKVRVKLDWPGQLSKSWHLPLEKALQTWFRTDLFKDIGKCEVSKVTPVSSDPLCAEIEITPPEVLKVFEKIKFVTLKIRDQDVTASFLSDETVLEEKESSPKVNSTVTSAEANNDVDSTVVNSMSNGTEPNSHAFTLPPHVYWYINHAYRQELEDIQKQHGVNISAEVFVSIKSTPSTKPDFVSKAFEDLQSLVQRCVVNFNEVNVPYTHVNADVVKETMHQSMSEKSRLVMNISASKFQVIGPKNFTDMISRNVDATILESQFTDFADKAGKMKVDTSVPLQRRSSLDMDTKDLQTHLEMAKVHWDLMNSSYEEQIKNIETKFGVSFKAETLENNLIIRVRAQSRGNQLADLESHALRALIQRYQKLASATVSCELKNPKDSSVVAQIKDTLDNQHYCVAAVDVYGLWKLVGLPEHLGPSVKDIEKRMGKNVFDEETKKLIGYSEDIVQRSGIAWATFRQEAAGGPMRDEAMSSKGQTQTNSGFSGETQVKENSLHDSKGEKEQCVICMDNFINKKKLKCGHEFCQTCIDKAVKSMGCICPVCKEIFGKLEGNQPAGKMTSRKDGISLPGYPKCGTITITYDIPGGVQTKKHPNPGQRFQGANRTAYLPDNEEGNHIFKLLQRAFDQKLIFTVGTSTTSGATNAVTWNDIHHKTTIYGGAHGYGYPDPEYLKRVKDELKAKGIE